ncbi:MAG: phosphate/phosphite/phosphonate ABC transporter substrate-binding protein [Elusimicrobia bacterium]|nr:phosphate/phosphite/phosphonate ABC transporter substrate-binding protein [Elusimicrobiota bacterium]
MKKILILVFAFTFFACFRSEKNIGSKDNPIIIALSYPYAEKLSSSDLSYLESYLNSKTGFFVKLSIYRDSVSLIKDFGAGKTDAALVTVNEYLIARQDYKANPVLQIVRGKGEKKYFAGIAVADKNINSLDDLKGKKIAARDPYSISGFILPGMFFAKEKIKPQFIFTGSHEASVKKVFSKEADAAAVYEKMIKADKRLKLIQIMGPVPNEPFICRKKFNSDYCARISDALLSFSSDKKGAQILSLMADISRFEPVNADVYSDLHEIILYSGKDIYSLVPESYKLSKINEPYYFD